MTVVILYLTLSLEQLVRIYLGWLQVISTCIQPRRGVSVFFFCMMVGAIDSFNFTSHTYIILSFSSPFTITVSR